MYTIPIENIIDVEDRFMINLLSTIQCQFSCSRCFYGSSPQAPSAYMSDEVLGKLDDFMNIIGDINSSLDTNIFPNINLVGGESTINVKKFETLVKEWIIPWVSGGGDFETTTNGAWLEQSPQRVMQILSLYKEIANNRYDNELPFVRISSSKWHDNYYRKNFTNKRGDAYMKSLLSRWTNDKWSEEQYCSCGSEIKYSREDTLYCDNDPEHEICDEYDEDMYFCPECNEGVTVSESETEDNVMLCDNCEHIVNTKLYFCEECNDGVTVSQGYGDTYCPDCGSMYELFSIDNTIIYVDHYDEGYIPTGAAAQNLGRTYSQYERKCTANYTENIITLKPDGQFTDFCCRGSQPHSDDVVMNILTTTPFHALAVWRAMKKDYDYLGDSLTCNSCNDQTNDWFSDNAELVKDICSKPIKLTINDGVIVVNPDMSYELEIA